MEKNLAIPKLLTAATTKELVNELAKREGVDDFTVYVDQRCHIEVSYGVTGNRPETMVFGPARILVVTD